VGPDHEVLTAFFLRLHLVEILESIHFCVLAFITGSTFISWSPHPGKDAEPNLTENAGIHMKPLVFYMSNTHGIRVVLHQTGIHTDIYIRRNISPLFNPKND
jgi:hypothetical protein